MTYKTIDTVPLDTDVLLWLPDNGTYLKGAFIGRIVAGQWKLKTPLLNNSNGIAYWEKIGNVPSHWDDLPADVV